MRLKKNLIISLLCTNIFFNSFGENKLSIHSDAASFFGYQPPIGQLVVQENLVKADFLFGAYSIEMNHLNDSVYQESVQKKFPFKKSKEIFSYIYRDGKYHFVEYDVLVGERRKEKDSIFYTKKIFENKIKTPVEESRKVLNGSFGDTAYFFVMGCEYKLAVKKIKDGSKTNYVADLSDIVKFSEDDGVTFNSTVNMDISKNKINSFDTKFLMGKNKEVRKIYGKKIH